MDRSAPRRQWRGLPESLRPGFGGLTTNQITPADVGKRVTVQYFDDDGARTEAVGVLERAARSGERIMLFVRRKDDVVLEVPLDRIRHGKVVRPPRVG